MVLAPNPHSHQTCPITTAHWRGCAEDTAEGKEGVICPQLAYAIRILDFGMRAEHSV